MKNTINKTDSQPLIRITKTDMDERIIEKPYYNSWSGPYGDDFIRDKGKLNYEGLNDHEKMLLYIYAWNRADICPYRRTVRKEFGWTTYKVGKMYKELKPYGLESTALVSEETGLLCGRGYFYDTYNFNQ